MASSDSSGKPARAESPEPEFTEGQAEDEKDLGLGGAVSGRASRADIDPVFDALDVAKATSDAPADAPASGRAAGIAIVSVLVVFVFFLGFFLGRMNGGSQVATTSASKPAADLPDMELAAFKARLKELEGGPVIVNFWASWCSPCRAEAPALERIYKKYKGRVALIGVNTSDTASGAQGFLADFDISYPNIRDASDAISVAYGVNAMPTTIFLDKDGKIVDTAMGQLNEEKFDAYIASFLKSSGG